MRYAIVESGGKQYRAVEGEIIEVDRLPDDEGTQIDLQRILFMADDADFLIGTPTISGIEVKATVVDHVQGVKVTHFRYSPKKRIRVRGGHRQQYTRLMVNFIGHKGETRRPEKPAANAGAEAAPKAAEGKSARATAKAAAKRPAEKPATRKATTSAKKSAGSSTRKSGKEG